VTPSVRGFRYMAISAVFFALMSLQVKVAGSRFPTMEVVLARSIVTLLLSGAMVWYAGVDPRGQLRGLLFLRGVLGFVALSCLYYAVIRLPLADATVLHFTNPVFTALMAAFFLAERIRARDGVVAIAGLLGVAIVARPGFLVGGEGALPAVPVAIGVLGAVFSAGAYTTVRALRGEHPSVVVLWFSGVCVVFSLPFALGGLVRPVGWEWLLLLGVGLATQFGQLFLTLGLREIRAGPATAIAYLQIVFAAGLGWVFLSERPDPWTGLGAAIIFLATGLLRRR